LCYRNANTNHHQAPKHLHLRYIPLTHHPAVKKIPFNPTGKKLHLVNLSFGYSPYAFCQLSSQHVRNKMIHLTITMRKHSQCPNDILCKLVIPSASRQSQTDHTLHKFTVVLLAAASMPQSWAA
jgi:hypothetical protein